MRSIWGSVLGIVVLSCAARGSHDPRTASGLLAFTGARILPIVGDPIEDGVLIVMDGTILAVGPASSTLIPRAAQLYDVSGRILMPGLVDTHSHICGPFAADDSAPIQSDVSALDSIDARDAGLQKAQAGGITTANLMPGSGHLLSGQTIYIKLKDGAIVDDLIILDETGRPSGGMKMANGTNSQRAPPFPGTRGKSAALVREAFVKAQAYRAKIERAAGDPSKLPDRDLAMEAMFEVLSGRRTVHHHTHRHDDILTVLRLQKEFGFKLVLQHVSEGWKVADQIAAADVPCSLIVIDSPGGKLEAVDMQWSTGAVLERAGVMVAFHTDDPVCDSRLFFRSAALAVRGGMSRDGALQALTINGARMLDLEARIGSLEAGKDADFIVLDGDPLSIHTHVLQTWVEGVLVFDLDREEDRLSATGGWGASQPQAAAMCCFEEGRQ